MKLAWHEIKLTCCIERIDASITESPTDLQFNHWIAHVLTHLSEIEKAFTIEVGVRLVDKCESADLNLSFRKKNGPTNILSFPYNEAPIELSMEPPVYLLGDLVICAPLVAEEAHQQNKSPLAHWAHLTVHGTLHLLGYDHIEEEEAADMEALEIELLSGLGFSSPY